jgi:hypothetical protein
MNRRYLFAAIGCFLVVKLCWEAGRRWGGYVPVFYLMFPFVWLLLFVGLVLLVLAWVRRK